jgi:hypothetical protein
VTSRMPRPAQFRATLSFHFAEHGEGRQRFFVFPESCHRRVPMAVEGLEELYTVGMWTEAPATLHEGDHVDVDCRVIAPDVLSPVIQPRVNFKLWDGGFFADGVATARFDDAWGGDRL